MRAIGRAGMVDGAMGDAKQFHVECLVREVRIPRIVSVSPEIVLDDIVERERRLPSSN